jgi:nitric oxide reductase subunit B
MHYLSQRIAYLFFATAMLLFGLQLVYGLLMALAHMGWDGLHPWVPFNVMRPVHMNLLLMWLLAGFMGASYYLVPEEVKRPVAMPWLAVIQWAAFVVVGVTAIVGFHFQWWEGRKFLEIPRPLDWLVVADLVLFLLIIGLTLWKAERRTGTVLVLYFGLFSAAGFYLFGMIDTVHPTVDSFWRWWVVHLWVEGVWELIMGAMLAFLLLRLTGVDREIMEKWLYVVVGLTFLSGVLGTGHHYYWIGTPDYWLWIGAIFSALEPLAFLGMAVWAVAMMRRGGRRHPNRMALLWTVGAAIMSFVGAGFLGFAHTLPQVNRFTHGTLITAMHGHLAFWGAYAMIVLAMITYAMPRMTGRAIYRNWTQQYAFWASNIGIVAMTLALAVAGIAQVYLERMAGMDFLVVQKEIEWHFVGMFLAALLFVSGVAAYIVDFVRYGLPVSDLSELPAPDDDPADDGGNERVTRGGAVGYGDRTAAGPGPA